ISDETEINIALLDIEMPGMNGIELAKLLREKNPDCIIIFITAYDRFDYAIEAMHIKAFDYLLKPWKEEKLTGLISEAIVNIKELSLENSANENLQESQKSAIKKYIKENYKRDISAGDVAGILGYSDVYFSKIFKQLFDDTFINYLTKVRIDKAKVLLKDVGFNIKEVGASVGYTDSNYFTKVFKRAVGMSPSEYRGNI
ncbi:MAG: AraC family transcriptional regulator, partial [Lachnospiraceae bacterium]